MLQRTSNYQENWSAKSIGYHPITAWLTCWNSWSLYFYTKIFVSDKCTTNNVILVSACMSVHVYQHPTCSYGWPCIIDKSFMWCLMKSLSNRPVITEVSLARTFSNLILSEYSSTYSITSKFVICTGRNVAIRSLRTQACTFLMPIHFTHKSMSIFRNRTNFVKL